MWWVIVNPDACNKGDTGEASGMIVILCSVLFKSRTSLIILYYEYIEVVKHFVISYVAGPLRALLFCGTA